MTIEPSVPWISKIPWRSSAESKLSRLCPCAPASKAVSTWIVDGTSTGNIVPAFGPVWISRSCFAFIPTAATRSTGPSRLTSAEK